MEPSESPALANHAASSANVSVHPEPDPAALPSLPILGHWHLRDFMAAVATAHKIVAAKNQQAETDDFLRAAVDGAIKVFS